MTVCVVATGCCHRHPPQHGVRARRPLAWGSVPPPSPGDAPRGQAGTEAAGTSPCDRPAGGWQRCSQQVAPHSNRPWIGPATLPSPRGCRQRSCGGGGQAACGTAGSVCGSCPSATPCEVPYRTGGHGLCLCSAPCCPRLVCGRGCVQRRHEWLAAVQRRAGRHQATKAPHPRRYHSCWRPASQRRRCVATRHARGFMRLQCGGHGGQARRAKGAAAICTMRWHPTKPLEPTTATCEWPPGQAVNPFCTTHSDKLNQAHGTESRGNCIAKHHPQREKADSAHVMALPYLSSACRFTDPWLAQPTLFAVR